MSSTYLPEALRILATGIAATAILDIWSLTLNRAFGLPITDWGHVGRWVAGLPSGDFRHTSIAAAPDVARERFIGWSTHYLIGVVYAAGYLIALAAMSRTPSFASAMIFGLATVFAPWLILQPGLGVGYFASKAPRPHVTRTLNLVSHLIFGAGLYFGWRIATLG
jgi:hypothetical protein